LTAPIATIATTPATAAALTSVQRDTPRPSSSAANSSAATANQTAGSVPAADRRVNDAMPLMEPAMSIAYARSGGSRLRSGPSGRASVAMTATTSPISSGSAMMLTSASRLSASPKKISSWATTLTLSSKKLIAATSPARNSAAHAIRGFRPCRPSRIPSPIPRKLAISRKFVKNPTYLTLAGIHRMSSSSTYRSAKLVRNSRTAGRASGSNERRRPSSPSLMARGG
jgi:hypothetical protein